MPKTCKHCGGEIKKVPTSVSLRPKWFHTDTFSERCPLTYATPSEDN